MNILTDVLSLIRRSVFAKKAELDDVLILGTNEQPEMTGVASPIPYKSIKVIKVRDFKVAAEHCDHANSPEVPASGTAQISQRTDSSDEEETCTIYFRSIKSLSSNLTLATSTDDNYVEITTTGEPNTAANVGSGFGIWKDKVGETLNFKSLIAGPNITIAESSNEITISGTPAQGLGYTEYVSKIDQLGTNDPTETVLSNNTGNSLTWTRLGVGTYGAQWATPTAPLYVVLDIGQQFKASPKIVEVVAHTDTNFIIEVFDISAATPQLVDDQLLNTPVKIRIYPSV